MSEQLTLWETQAEKPVREPLTVRKPLTDREQLFEWAKERQFPYFQFPLGGRWFGIVQAGEENCRAFCERGDLYNIQIALKNRRQTI